MGAEEWKLQALRIFQARQRPGLKGARTPPGLSKAPFLLRSVLTPWLRPVLRTGAWPNEPAPCTRIMLPSPSFQTFATAAASLSIAAKVCLHVAMLYGYCAPPSLSNCMFHCWQNPFKMVQAGIKPCGFWSQSQELPGMAYGNTAGRGAEKKQARNSFRDNHAGAKKVAQEEGARLPKSRLR